MASPASKPLFSQFTVAKLKEYLKSKHQLSSGRKEELIKRAEATYLLFQQDCDRSTESDRPNANAISDLSDEWTEPETVDVHQWPPFTEKELYNFLVYKKQQDGVERKARRQVKAKEFYDSCHVHSVRYHPISANDDECYVKCAVIPSAAPADTKKRPDYCVWIKLSKITAHVGTGFCTCPAGQEGACNHVAALLYALIDVTDSKHKGLDASTSAQCKWKTPRKRKLSPQKVQNLTPGKRLCDRPTTSAVNVNDFMLGLRTTLPSCGLFVNFSAATTEVPRPKLPDFPSPTFMYIDNVNLLSPTCQFQFENFVSHIKSSVGPDYCVVTEQVTRGQGSNELWKEARRGKLTSSVFGRVMKLKDSTCPTSLIKLIMGYGADFENQHTAWGKSHEKAAVRTYKNLIKKTHPHVQVSECGLHVCSDTPYLCSTQVLCQLLTS